MAPEASVFNQAPEASQSETPAKCLSHLISSIDLAKVAASTYPATLPVDGTPTYNFKSGFGDDEANLDQVS